MRVKNNFLYSQTISCSICFDKYLLPVPWVHSSEAFGNLMKICNRKGLCSEADSSEEHINFKSRKTLLRDINRYMNKCSIHSINSN